jgi:hypothetical protein
MKAFRFRVQLEWESEVWRDIDIRSDQTLDDLHYAIQEAFDWDDDHLYAFFLSGRYWDKKTDYSSPREEGPRPRKTDQTAIESLNLREGQSVAYIERRLYLRLWRRMAA